MKVSYSRKVDILMIQLSDEKIDFAEEMGPIIIHFTKGRKPVLLEILDASELVGEITKIGMKAQAPKPVELLMRQR
ncbi:MAG: DUF2283 domain-containing protein [Candidatus Bathyarchaeia archaeon]